MTFRRILLLTSLVVFGWAVSAGQVAAPGDLKYSVVEVTYDPEKPPTTIAVRSDCPCGMFYSQFQRTEGWIPHNGSRPVNAVDISVRVFSGAVMVRINVFTGEKFREFEELVTEFELKRHSVYKVKELLKFGIEPISIRLIEVPRTVGQLPTVENKSNSVIVQLEPLESAIPTFRARLVNTSHKAIATVTLGTKVNNKDQLVATRFDPTRAPLILPGDVYDFVLPIRIFERPDGARTFIITSVVFEDETFEGDGRAVSIYKNALLGEKHRLALVVPVLRGALDDWNSLDFNSLISTVENGPGSVDDEFIKQHLSFFSRLNDKDKEGWRISLGRNSLQVKTRTVNSLREMQSLMKEDKNAGKKAFVDLITVYEGWLKRVTK